MANLKHTKKSKDQSPKTYPPAYFIGLAHSKLAQAAAQAADLSADLSKIRDSLGNLRMEPDGSIIRADNTAEISADFTRADLRKALDLILEHEGPLAQAVGSILLNTLWTLQMEKGGEG